MMRVHIHGNVEYKDIASHTASTPQVGKIANSYCSMANPATTPVNGIYKSGWKRYAFKFQYWDENNNIISQPTVDNTPTPSYILASLSTNASANVGPNDSLAFDDIFCVYDKGLASLTINGVENNTIRDYLNYYEYLTHEKTINSGSKTYEYNDLICYTSANDIPQISATPKSSLILSMNITQATLENPTAIIKIIHNDSSYYEHKIHFSNLHPAVQANLNSPTGTYTACQGEELTVTVSGAPSYQWSNGSTQHSISVHPMLVIASLIVGGAAGGIVGMLLAVPVAGLLKLYFDRFIQDVLSRRNQESVNVTEVFEDIEGMFEQEGQATPEQEEEV